MDISDRLQDLRKKANYSQEQVADLLGISRQAISKWESGQGKPELDNIIKLTEIYNVSADYIISGQEHSVEIVPQPKRELSHTARKTIGIIAIVVSTALVTILFIAALGFMAKYWL